MIHTTFQQWNMHHKRIFVRADLNVTIIDSTISNDFRLQSIRPTLDFIINQGGSIVLATHIGRPKNNEKELSTTLLLPWFKNHGYTIRFIKDFTKIKHEKIIPKEIILIENLRFFPGEKKADPFFAKQLAQTANYYINDAFGVIHEHDCSVTLLPYEFPENRRSIGFLIEKELSIINMLKKNPKRPFTAILGGGKIKDKIPLIQSLLTQVDTLIIYPALCFSFLQTMHKSIGKSLVDPTLADTCRAILRSSENNKVTIKFPLDYQIAYNSIDGPLTLIGADAFPDNAIGISIGPKTITQCINIINESNTIFFNCAMGFANRPETLESTQEIIHAMAQSSATTIVAGGDSVDRALSTPDHFLITHLSSGGGASLAFLGNEVLPGLAAFEEK